MGNTTLKEWGGGKNWLTRWRRLKKTLVHLGAQFGYKYNNELERRVRIACHNTITARFDY